MTSIKGNNKILKDFKNQIFERFLHEVYLTKRIKQQINKIKV